MSISFINLSEYGVINLYIARYLIKETPLDRSTDFAILYQDPNSTSFCEFAMLSNVYFDMLD